VRADTPPPEARDTPGAFESEALAVVSFAERIEDALKANEGLHRRLKGLLSEVSPPATCSDTTMPGTLHSRPAQEA
jgi:hypothetical protein